MTGVTHEPPAEPPTRGDAARVVEAAAAGAFGAIPLFGPTLQEVVHLAAGAVFQRRLDEWFKSVAQGISELQSHGKAPTWDDLACDERFVDSLVVATRAAQGTSRQEKRLALRNAVMSSASSTSPAEDLERRFIDLVDLCVPDHLRLLLFLNDPRRALRIAGQRRSVVWARMEAEFVAAHGVNAEPPSGLWLQYMRQAFWRELVGAFDGDQDMTERLLFDLDSWGLLDRHSAFSVEASFVSRMGQTFLEYIGVRPDTAEAFAAYAAYNW